jgi:hypothetical protein
MVGRGRTDRRLQRGVVSTWSAMIAVPIWNSERLSRGSHRLRVATVGVVGTFRDRLGLVPR